MIWSLSSNAILHKNSHFLSYLLIRLTIDKQIGKHFLTLLCEKCFVVRRGKPNKVVFFYSWLVLISSSKEVTVGGQEMCYLTSARGPWHGFTRSVKRAGGICRTRPQKLKPRSHPWRYMYPIPFFLPLSLVATQAWTGPWARQISPHAKISFRVGHCDFPITWITRSIDYWTTQRVLNFDQLLPIVFASLPSVLPAKWGRRTWTTMLWITVQLLSFTLYFASRLNKTKPSLRCVHFCCLSCFVRQSNTPYFAPPP